MDVTPDYAAYSAPTAGLGIVLPDRIPPLPTGSVLQFRRPGGETAGQNGRGSAGDGRGARPVAADEPLVDAGRDLTCLNCYHAAGWAGTSATTWLRLGVVTRLLELDLPDGFGLALFDGWRSPTTVAALYDHYYGPGSTLEAGYLADPAADPGDSGRTGPPPHLTGGAVDLTLTWNGTPLSLGTPFDEFTPRAHLAALEAADDGADRLDRDLRRLLHAVMVDAGFAPYDHEWWHFSYGDAAWASWHGRSTALYGATSPNR